MNDNGQLNKNVSEKIVDHLNERMEQFICVGLDAIFDKLEEQARCFPQDVQMKFRNICSFLRNDTEFKQKTFTLWSEQLYEEGLIPKGYKGLSNQNIIANFRQNGYLDGMYCGYILSMMAMADNNIPQESITKVRDTIRPYVMSANYKNTDEIIGHYKEEKYSWIEKKN